MMNVNRTQELQDRVREAISNKRMLKIVGGNSKHFYGNPDTAAHKTDLLETRIHQGIVSYEPSELVITARAGTPLKEIQQLLAENNQMLPFDPPHFSEHATLGGAIATGLSGSRRPFTGSARDFVLGVKIITGKGEVMSFGGQVMKNVAGYDVSRLMVGALGTLGLLLEISIKVLPLPIKEITQCIAMSQQDALSMMHKLNQTSLPLSALAYENDKLYIRLSGAETAVNSSHKKVGGETLVHDEKFWQQVNEQSHSFFNNEKPLWRLSVPYIADIKLDEEKFIDWAGALYWIHSDKPAGEIQKIAKEQGGSASLFKVSANQSNESSIPGDRFMPLATKIKQLHVNLKTRFDPYGIFNFGRLYSDL
ncbi:MAG: glycolate oxidase subunit GlcE [Gammaproteobacteria bacterium]|nr:glycolate oxidase subunit GlcE [Gammaproteobacteria bacterium]